MPPYQQVPGVPPQPPKGSSKKKLIIIGVVGVVLIAAIVGAVLFFTKCSNLNGVGGYFIADGSSTTSDEAGYPRYICIHVNGDGSFNSVFLDSQYNVTTKAGYTMSGKLDSWGKEMTGTLTASGMGISQTIDIKATYDEESGKLSVVPTDSSNGTTNLELQRATPEEEAKIKAAGI